MSRTKAQRLQARERSAEPVKDSLQNLAARLGVGRGSDNLISQTEYQLNPITRNRVSLDFLYRGSWIVGAAVDSPADDMTQAGVDLSGGVQPDDAEILQSAFDRLDIWGQIAHGMRWGRLYGGAIVVMLIDGQDFSQPFRPETVGKGQFKGLMAIDRWQLQPTVGDVVEELGPDFGKPVYYTVVADNSIQSGMRSPMLNKKIHYSRVFRFEGHALPFYQRISEQGWGMSVIERLYDRLVAFDSATQGAAQLIFKAHLRTLSIEGLTQILSGPPAAVASLASRIDTLRKYASTEGMSVIDAKDKLEHYNYTFSGLDAIILQFAEQISGALQIPLVRLLGQSPAGLNSSGEADLRTYYDGIRREQEKALKRPLTRIFDVMHRSELGREMDEGFAFMFNSLWQMSDNEKADVCTKITASVIEAKEAGLIDDATALKELRKSAQVTGTFSNITDEDITEAENAPPEPELEEPPVLGLPEPKSPEEMLKRETEETN